MKHKVLVVGLSFLLLGCAGFQKLPTSSGQPEAVLHGYSAKQVRDFVSYRMSLRGFSVVRSDDYTVAMDKQIDSFMGQVVFGSQYNSKPAVRVVFQTYDSGTGEVRLVGSLYIVTNPQSQYEQLTPVQDGRELADFQEKMSGLQAQMDSQIKHN